MRKKISTELIKEWVEDYEQGKTESFIAKKDINNLYDARTVKKHIDQARLRRDARSANVEILKEAINKHQGQLLACINNIISAFEMPPGDLAFLENKYGLFMPIQLSSAKAKYDDKEKWAIILDAESTPHWELLREHLRGDRLWALINKWQAAMGSHIGSRLTFKNKVESLFNKKTGYKVRKGDTTISEKGYLYPGGCNFFYQMEIDKALGFPMEKYVPLKECIVDNTQGHLQAIPGNITLAYSPGSEDNCKQAIIEACGEMQNSAERKTVWSTYQELKQSAVKAQKAAEEISLLGLVPGTCRICRRLGI